MELIAKYQLDIMLFMCGMCGILAVMTALTKSLPKLTRRILIAMEVSAMLLLLFDRFAYIYRGDVSSLGFVMVRVSNCVVYVMSLFIPFLVTRFVNDICINEVGLKKTPALLVAADAVFGVGMALVVISQFTGLYYTFDANNNYQRAPLNVLCYAAPLIIVILQELTIFKNRKKVKKNIVVSIMISIALPMVSSVLQIFAYGVSIINMTTALVVCVFYTYALNFLSEAAERARIREIEFYKQGREKEAAMFKETTEALANAIDAKDKYTRGHSTRVASYSRYIAKEAGLPEKKCDEVYFAGLLHDIGKIGVSSEIIHKKGKLSEEEFEQIKTHAEKGEQILSIIKHANYLGVGARSHHERYDGGGYPDGLSGEDIPEIARIIAVADAYDAMTSERSYRKPLEKEKVQSELKNGMGTQFDPVFAKIMLKYSENGIQK